MQTDTNQDEVEEIAGVRQWARPVGSSLVVALLMAVDELNPVKVFCSYTFGYVKERHVAILVGLMLAALCYAQKSRILYHAARSFFRCTVNNMFFRSVEIVGIDNLPREGPVILTGNHNNQFVDGVLLLTNCHREISFMIAQKSWDRPFVGFLAKCFNCIPVSRPQDTAFTGAGRVKSDGTGTLRGTGTRFEVEVQPGCQLDLKSSGKTVKIVQVISNTEVIVDSEVPKSDASDGQAYKVLPKIDQSMMYNTVYQGLRTGICLGIFPEGGSHDRTDLLPLKAGVAIIAIDAWCKHSIKVPIVPVGLNYFQGHRFGGRVVVEFGPPIEIPDSLYTMNETDRRGATEELLQMIASGMRGVIVPSQDYRTLQQIYMVRRLYSDNIKLTPEKAMDLTRRFAVGTALILQAADKGISRMTVSPSTENLKLVGALPAPTSPTTKDGDQMEMSKEEARSVEEFKSEVEAYMASLKRLGLRDHQVRQIGWWSVGDLVGRLLYLIVSLAVAAFTHLLFNLPVMYVASKLAAFEQKKSLKASTVKLAARDVVMSYKIIYVLSLVPVMYIVYGCIMLFFFTWSTKTYLLIMLALPAFAFLGMKASEQGVRAYKDIVPLCMRLLPQNRAEQDRLPARRADLQRRLQSMVRKFGPRLGDLYTKKDVDWASVHRTRSEST